MSVAFVGFGSDGNKKRKNDFSQELGDDDDIGEDSGRSDTSGSEVILVEPNFAQEGNIKKRMKIPKSENESFYNSYQPEAKDAGPQQSFGTLMPTPVIPKKRGRPPKPESEKAKNNRPKGTIRVALGQRNSKTKVSRTELTPSKDESSPFPLIQQTNSVKKSRGRPRIHPPKDPSVKRPRGRPRTIALEGEQAWKNECGRLRRLVAKQNDLIAKLKQRLADLGQPYEDSQLEVDEDQINDSQNQEKSKIVNESSDDEDFHPLILEASNIEDTHQTYVGMFVDSENKEEKGDSDDSDNSSV